MALIEGKLKIKNSWGQLTFFVGDIEFTEKFKSKGNIQLNGHTFEFKWALKTGKCDDHGKDYAFCTNHILLKCNVAGTPFWVPLEDIFTKGRMPFVSVETHRAIS